MKPIRLLSACALLLAACGGTLMLPQDEVDAMRKVYDEILIEREPLCIGAGPFPYRSGTRPDYFRGISCDKCQALEQAGFLVRRFEGDVVVYDLSDAGRPLFRKAADPAWIEVVRARYEQSGRKEKVDEKALERPRLCFGQTRFHHISDALAPFDFSGNTVRSVKIVAEAKDTSGLLFDPRLPTLGLDVPPKPDAGEPALYPPQIVTFEWVRGDPRPDISSTRYGAWVNEP